MQKPRKVELRGSARESHTQSQDDDEALGMQHNVCTQATLDGNIAELKEPAPAPGLHMVLISTETAQVESS